MTSKQPLKYIDLFAGCGGLSLGLRRAGGELLLAVEKSEMAAETYYHNFIERISEPDTWKSYLKLPVLKQVENGLLVNPVSELLQAKTALADLAGALPDLVVGGPPCQGFSLAGKRNPDDVRNKLPWEFLQVVEETKPKMVIIENVVGMRQKFTAGEKETVFDQLQRALSETGSGYLVQAVEVNALHYGAPQHRPRLMIIGIRTDVAADTGVWVSNDLWRSNFTDKLEGPIPPLAPVPVIRSEGVRTVGLALADLENEDKANDYSELMKSDWGSIPNNGEIKNHHKRSHVSRTENRFRLYQYLNSQGIDSKIFAIDDESYTDAKPALIAALSSAHMPAIAPDGTNLANSIEDLAKAVFDCKTKKHSQRVLLESEPARTVVTIGDDYVHPTEPRTFTVRELARFQGFPNSFEFRAKETTGGLNRRTDVPQYSQVGNAVSPFLAYAVGLMARRVLSKDQNPSQ